MVNKILLLLLLRVPSLKFVGLSVPKIRLIFGHGAKRPDLDLELVQNVRLLARTSFVTILLFLRVFVVELRASMHQIDDRTLLL